VLRYDGSLLIEVYLGSFPDQDLTFSYDAESRLLASVEDFGGTGTRFSYDAADRRVSAATTFGSGELGFGYEYAYDDHGNLVTRTTTRPRFGDVYQVDTYEYEPSPTPMYNHQLLILEVQPVYGTTFGFLQSV